MFCHVASWPPLYTSLNHGWDTTRVKVMAKIRWYTCSFDYDTYTIVNDFKRHDVRNHELPTSHQLCKQLLKKVGFRFGWVQKQLFHCCLAEESKPCPLLPWTAQCTTALALRPRAMVNWAVHDTSGHKFWPFTKPAWSNRISNSRQNGNTPFHLDYLVCFCLFVFVGVVFHSYFCKICLFFWCCFSFILLQNPIFLFGDKMKVKMKNILFLIAVCTNSLSYPLFWENQALNFIIGRGCDKRVLRAFFMYKKFKTSKI